MKIFESKRFLLLVFFLYLNTIVKGEHNVVDEITYNEKICHEKVDLYILMDGSGSIGYDNWISYAVPLVYDIVKNLNVSNDGIHLYLSVFTHYLREYIELGSSLSTNREFALNIIKNLKNKYYLHGSTNLTIALSRVLQDNFIKKKGREDAVQLILIFTDGVPDDKETAMQEVIKLKKMNAKFSVIGVGMGINREFNKRLVGCSPYEEKCDLYSEASWVDVKDIIAPFLKKVCVEIEKVAHCGSWGEWTPCSVTCGEGIKTRKRNILHKGCSDHMTALCERPECPAIVKPSVTDIPEVVPEDNRRGDVPDNVPDNAPENKKRGDVPDYFPEDNKPAAPDNVPDNAPENKKRGDVPDYFPEDNKPAAPYNVPDNSPEDNQPEAPDNAPEENQPEVPDNVPEENQPEVPDNVPEDNQPEVPDNVPEDRNPEIPEEKKPENIPENRKEEINEYIPKNIPDDVEIFPNENPGIIKKNQHHLPPQVIPPKNVHNENQIINNVPEHNDNINKTTIEDRELRPHNTDNEYIRPRRNVYKVEPSTENVENENSEEKNKKTSSDNKYKIAGGIIGGLALLGCAGFAYKFLAHAPTPPMTSEGAPFNDVLGEGEKDIEENEQFKLPEDNDWN
ncbi:thrombospondin-related anonymous protein, putative [Plasmodium relictum]|uniref:Thrombospondin-related anonymous protein, putative n=1 Tax=Plasmodium relictum TaxID=85471 RepID=A0A1J1HAT9_PLARL|nr:thrombospondin-related anonymous protein, putative [Plasmodium relictum]CRH01727.1 thrombospondin-related anonymous protein, putative [Plasmodium relictum]